MSLLPTPRRNSQVMRLKHRYGPIGGGTFGRVYMALVTNEHALRPVALKKVHISGHVAHPPLLHEAAALLRLRGHRSIPEVYGWGCSQYFEYLSVQLLGPDIYAWFILKEKPLTSRNLTAIVWQMLDVLEYIHSKGIVHCDVKPSNIMLGRGDNKSHVFLSDFGLSLPLDPNPLFHRTTRQRGSAYYMSLNTHRHEALSPHDDMESLAYTILELQTGSLPWGDCKSQADLFISKERWTGERWTVITGYPKVFGDFLDAVRDRGRALDYARWKQDLCGDSTPTPCGADPPLKYDPFDDDAPIDWTVYAHSEPYMPLTAAELARVPKSPESWSSLSECSHYLHARSTWSGPITLEEEATFGDELSLALRGLALIDRPPTCGASLRPSDPSEVMKRFDDILGENAGRAVEGDSHCVKGVGRNEGEPADSGYGSVESQSSNRDQVEVAEATRQAGDVTSVLDDSDFRQFYDPQYGRM